MGRRHPQNTAYRRLQPMERSRFLSEGFRAIAPRFTNVPGEAIAQLERVQRHSRRWLIARFVVGSADRLLLQFLNLPAEDSGVAEVDLELGRTRQRSLNQRLRERVLDVLLKRPPQWTGAIAPVRQRFLQNIA